MQAATRRIAGLLFCSGMCALIYQTVWLRELRLIFGSSTAASAAVLAIFMGGLGLGGVVLGKRTDQNRNPLGYYANLEFLIAGSALASPILLDIARWIYVTFGGTTILGQVAGTMLRLVLAILVLCVPTFLMGGTLPAAARAVETESDQRRRGLAVLYGLNTLGAVTGAAISSFVLLEVLGNRTTLRCAVLINILVALVARSMARGLPDVVPDEKLEESAEKDDAEATPKAPLPLVLAASGLVGFAFMLMELVWYRMLSPLLGGSLFTFGLILALALLGIGLGGVAYSLLGERRPAMLRGLALTCGLEALCIAIPFALGDRLAFLSIMLRPLGELGFFGQVMGWSVVAGIVVVPAAFVSGVQFPLLIGLLGRGRKEIGQQIGLAYAWNTGGSILGSLVGGFGLLPALGAPKVWGLVTLVLAGLGVVATFVDLRRKVGGLLPRLSPALVCVAAALLHLSEGPSAAWRHSGIGAGRATYRANQHKSPTEVLDWQRAQRRAIGWEVDGIESSVALAQNTGMAFVVGGKVDGNSRADAGTMIMSSMIGGMLHPNPKSALVVGLGTGGSAGWIATLPEMDTVDVVEIEPAIARVAKDCEPINERVMDNPKIKMRFADAREVLLTTRKNYDIIFSEPSNPYRAGIASLFTKEYYEAAAARLNQGGIFLQWLQAYEVDGETVRTAYATLHSVFPVVSTWQTEGEDMVLVASKQPISFDVPALRARLEKGALKRALRKAWQTEGLEGLLAHHIANPDLVNEIVKNGDPVINTDDHNQIEFGFAHTVGQNGQFDMLDLLGTSILRGMDRPPVTGGEVDWAKVNEERMQVFVRRPTLPQILSRLSPTQRVRNDALRAYHRGDLRGALAIFRGQPDEPVTQTELELLAESLADAGDENAIRYIDAVGQIEPVTAMAIRARLLFRKGQRAEAAELLSQALIRYRVDAWPGLSLMARALSLGFDIARGDRTLATKMFEAMREPFAVRVQEESRLRMLPAILAWLPFERYCNEALSGLEPHFPYDRPLLEVRLSCYQASPEARKDGRLQRAADDLAQFIWLQPANFLRDLMPKPGSQAAGPEKKSP